MEIRMKDVLAWCQHPDNPRECLEEVYKVLKLVLGKQNMEDSDEEIPPTVISAREQMYQAMSGTSSPSSTPVKEISSSLKAAMDMPSAALEERRNIPEQTVEVTYMCSDKYKDGLFAIRNPDYLRILKETHTEFTANKPPIYFPFGFGKEKDLLKVKKADFGVVSKQMVLTLKFSRWERDGKIGYSCYASQPKGK